jgi:hypothetical protein
MYLYNKHVARRKQEIEWIFKRVRTAWLVQKLISMASVRITQRRGVFGAETGGLEEHAKVGTWERIGRSPRIPNSQSIKSNPHSSKINMPGA